MRLMISLFIIGALSAIVVGSITKIVVVAFSDDYSNFHLAAVMANEIDFLHEAAAKNPEDAEDESFACDEMPVQCDMPNGIFAPLSIMEYFSEKSLPTQFSGRVFLARNNATDACHDPYQQNLFLLFIIRENRYPERTMCKQLTIFCRCLTYFPRFYTLPLL